MTKALILNLISLIFFQSYPTSFEGKVVNVVDGNTIEVEAEDGELVKVMLKDVDSPELSQAYGEEAKAYTEKLVHKKKVAVELKGKDRWGNKLAVVKLKNGKLLHEELLKEGLAWANERETEETLNQLQASAKSKGSGLWKADDPTPPWVYRRKQTMMKPKSLH